MNIKSLLFSLFMLTPCLALAQDSGPGPLPQTTAPSWNIYLNTSQTGLTSATRVVVAYDTAATVGGNTPGICDLVTNKGRCTPPAGTYWVCGYTNISSGGVVAANNNIGLTSIRINGVTLVQNFDFPASVATAGSTSAYPGGCSVVTLNGTDYVEITGYSDGVGNAVSILSGITRTKFTGVRIN